jgi:hypothetical protein
LRCWERARRELVEMMVVVREEDGGKSRNAKSLLKMLIASGLVATHAFDILHPLWPESVLSRDACCPVETLSR